MGKRPSLIKAAIDRLDQQMRIGASRYEAKQAASSAARAAGQSPPWSVATGGIHSYGTRSTYQEQVLRFVNWARQSTHIRRLDELDAQADALATHYLEQLLAAGLSAHSLQTARSALRQFFGDRTLAATLTLPRRTRAGITRSRHAAARDRHVNRDHWRSLIRFCRATGLRAREVRDLRTRDVFHGRDGRWRVQVLNGKGGKTRIVEHVLTPPDIPGELTLTLAEARATLPMSAAVEISRADVSGRSDDGEVWEVDGNEDNMYGEEGHLMRPQRAGADWLAALLAARKSEERLFARIPAALDIHAERRWYAQTLYRALSGRELPSATADRLRPHDYDREAALTVSRQLGHNRLDVALRNYLR